MAALACRKEHKLNPKSHTLFHFTKSIETLKSIIKHGFWPRYCAEDVNWLGYKKYEFIAYPMVCFCDIPLSRTEEHVRFYGEYGIGLSKDWAECNKITPIQYVSTSSNIPRTFREIIDLSFHLEDGKKFKSKQNIRYLLAHSKPTEGNMVIAGKVVQKEFYQESEWRYVPLHDEVIDYVKKEEFENETRLEELNQLSKEHCSIKFSPRDIKYIFVKNDSDIPEIINFIQEKLEEFPSVDLKVLLSRVTSLESISRDL